MRSTGLVDGRRWRLPRRREIAVGLIVLLTALLTARTPVVIVLPVLAALDVAVLLYWFGVRGRGHPSPAAPPARAPLGRMAEVIKVTGVLLMLNAFWLIGLGLMTQYGVLEPSTTDWNALEASGFHVSPERPVTFGARAVVVATAVWMVGFGLAKALGGKP